MLLEFSIFLMCLHSNNMYIYIRLCIFLLNSAKKPKHLNIHKRMYRVMTRDEKRDEKRKAVTLTIKPNILKKAKEIQEQKLGISNMSRLTELLLTNWINEKGDNFFD